MSVKLQTIDDQRDPTFNQLLGINNQGEISGYFGSGADPLHPNKGYTITPPYGQANFHNENFPGSAQTQVTGLNNADHADRTVGFYVDGFGNNIGFVEHDGQFKSVFDPAGSPLATQANQKPATQQLLGVNGYDVAVGFYTDANGVNHGFTYDVGQGSFKEVNVAGFTNVTAAAINNSGDIAGFGTFDGKTEGFVEDTKGHVTPLVGPSGATAVNALGLNSGGDVVGSWTDAQSNTHGFLFNPKSGAYATIDAGAKTETVINGLNDKGELVGFYMDAAKNTHGLLVHVSGS